MTASIALPEYQIYALRYATRDGRRSSHFIGGDAHDGPMRMDYFLWAIVGAGRTYVVDCGFTAEVAARRKREFLRSAVDALALIDIDAATVEDLIITHLHYDHVGNFACFPKARIHLQEPELAYATGRYMRHPFMSHAFEVEDVVGIVRLNYAGRVEFHNGTAELAPGLSLHLAGGHTAGLQFVRVHTQRGWVVLASDVVHYYENIETRRPFTTALNVGDMLEGFDKVRALASSSDHVIPGHDPKVMELYPAPRPDLAGMAVRLNVAPKTST
jgi:glyoxylase-like metal-dependent hydrolase (beta-lactamase superfamily II)